MQENTVSLTRQELYEQVWSEPITHLSKFYNLSDVGLAKICKKMDVPVPGRGYWEKKHHGYNPERTPLPPFKGPGNGRIRITIREKQDTYINDEFEERIVFEGLPENHISVKSSIKNPHRLVEQTEICLRKGKPDDKGLLYSYDKDCLDLAVSPKNLDRALLIYDTLIKACEDRGYEVSVSNSSREHRTTVKILEEYLEIGIREPYVEKKNDFDHRPSSVFDRREYAPSGFLSLTIKNTGYAKQKSWNDGKKRLLEDCLNDFLEGLIRVAVHEKKRSEERERGELERQEKIRQYQDTMKAQQEEKAKVTKLRQEAADWHESRQIRAYISAIKEKARASGSEINPDSDLGKWFIWANQQADRLDPLAESPSSILDIELEPPFRWY